MPGPTAGEETIAFARVYPRCSQLAIGRAISAYPVVA